MKEEKGTFTVRSYTKSELAHLYNPQLTLKKCHPSTSPLDTPQRRTAC